MTTITI